MPRKLGRGSGLKTNDIFWTTFLNNAAFFSVGNKNFLSGAATALGIDSLSAAEVAFMDQVDSDGKPIGVLPAILLVPTALSALGSQLFKSLELRDTTAATKFPVASAPVYRTSANCDHGLLWASEPLRPDQLGYDGNGFTALAQRPIRRTIRRCRRHFHQPSPPTRWRRYPTRTNPRSATFVRCWWKSIETRSRADSLDDKSARIFQNTRWPWMFRAAKDALANKKFHPRVESATCRVTMCAPVVNRWTVVQME